MCQTFETLFRRYEAGVRAGALAFNERERLYRMKADHGDAYRDACAAEHAAHVQVQQARDAIWLHKHACPACRHMLNAVATSRREPLPVDPAEYEVEPLLAMMEATA